MTSAPCTFFLHLTCLIAQWNCRTRPCAVQQDTICTTACNMTHIDRLIEHVEFPTNIKMCFRNAKIAFGHLLVEKPTCKQILFFHCCCPNVMLFEPCPRIPHVEMPNKAKLQVISTFCVLNVLNVLNRHLRPNVLGDPSHLTSCSAAFWS